MTNQLISDFQMLARYNRLANEKLYGDRKQIRPAFFQSIHSQSIILNPDIDLVNLI